MKASTVSTHLHVVRAKRKVQAEKDAEKEIAGSGMETSALVKRGVRAAQRWPDKERIARIEELQAHLKAGTYRVDSRIIAECMLQNETHFV